MEVNRKIWEKKYRFGDEASPSDTFRRVARAAAQVDAGWEDRFFEEMNGLRFLPGGRILAAAGTNKAKATLSNCFVMPAVEDNMISIMEALKDGALTMQAGGGIGINFSRLRPYGAPVGGTGSIASGPVSFMHMWNAMSVNISGVGDRKGAMIAVLNCDHPDIMGFVKAKANNTKETKVLEKFNISVGVTDAFLDAVRREADWDLKFGGKVYKTISARELWDLIMENAHKKAEPGILFLDRMNQGNPLYYVETIDSTNPCGEQPLGPYGSCNLGAVNLACFVRDPFTDHAAFDFPAFEETVRVGVRFLDDILDVNYYPLACQRDDAMNKRKVGLGIMGLASAFAMLKVRYASDQSIELVEQIMATMRDTAYACSVDLAKEKEAFPLLDPEKYLAGEFVRQLPASVKKGISDHGIRNACLLTLAPTGSISQLAGNVTGGVEPMFCLEFDRNNYGEDITIKDPTFELYCELVAKVSAKHAPPFFVEAHNLTPDEHLRVMAACQKYIDASISKTINLPAGISVKEMEHVYLLAHEVGCKGCTVYREGSLDEEILKRKDAAPKQQSVALSFERPYELDGKVYKVKLPESKHAFYLTFSHTIDQSGKKTPVELFVATKDPTVEEWTKSLGRLVSAVFRNVEDPTFLAEEMKEVYAQSGFFSARRRKFVPSLVAEFGEVMAEYFAAIGLMEGEVPIEAYSASLDSNGEATSGKATPKLAYCRKCGKQSVIFQEGCAKCLNPGCLWLRCG